MKATMAASSALSDHSGRLRRFGLAITKRIVWLDGATIEVESRIDRESKIAVTRRLVAARR